MRPCGYIRDDAVQGYGGVVADHLGLRILSSSAVGVISLELAVWPGSEFSAEIGDVVEEGAVAGCDGVQENVTAAVLNVVGVEIFVEDGMEGFVDLAEGADGAGGGEMGDYIHEDLAGEFVEGESGIGSLWWCGIHVCRACGPGDVGIDGQLCAA